MILQHCSTELEVKLKALAEWPTINANRDVIKLMMMVRTITHQHDETKQGTAALVDSDVRLYSYTQEKSQSNNSYMMKGFRSHINTINAYDGHAWFHPGMWQRHMGEVLKEHKYNVESDVADPSSRSCRRR